MIIITKKYITLVINKSFNYLQGYFKEFPEPFKTMELLIYLGLSTEYRALIYTTDIYFSIKVKHNAVIINNEKMETVC